MRLLTFAIIAGCLAWQAPAYARLRSETITPTNTATSELTFDVSARDHGNLTFSITVRRTGELPLSTNLTGTLILKDSDGIMAEVPVTQKQDGNRLAFSFTIHKKFLPESTVAVSSRRDIADGKIAVGTVYYIRLADFMRK